MYQCYSSTDSSFRSVKIYNIILTQETSRKRPLCLGFYLL